MLRGDIHEFRAPRGMGHEQQGRRYGVIVQANELLPRSVVLIAPTSHSARAASFRPEIDSGRRPMSPGGKCLVNVHAKSCLILETSADAPARNQGPRGASTDRTRAIPCTVRVATGCQPFVRDRRRRARYVPDRR